MRDHVCMEGNVLWLMGPTSSGKTTIAKNLCQKLREANIPTVFYDGDEVRNLFGPALGFEARDRLKVVRMIVYMANKAASAGLFAIVAALTAYDDARSYVRENVNNLIVGHVTCDIDICASRDPKGLYRMAKQGKINTLPGYNSEYHPPEMAHIELDTGKCSLPFLLNKLMFFLTESGSSV